MSRSQRKFLECTSRFRIHGHGRRLGAENQDPNFGPGNRSLYRRTEGERERERESFIRNNLHNGVVSGAARGQALRGPMWAGLTPDSKGDPTGDTGGLIAADRRHHTCLRDAREHCRPLQAARQVPGKKN